MGPVAHFPLLTKSKPYYKELLIKKRLVGPTSDKPSGTSLVVLWAKRHFFRNVRHVCYTSTECLKNYVKTKHNQAGLLETPCHNFLLHSLNIYHNLLNGRHFEICLSLRQCVLTAVGNNCLTGLVVHPYQYYPRYNRLLRNVGTCPSK